MEDCVYEARSAQLLSGSLMDYAMPRAEASGGAATHRLAPHQRAAFEAVSRDGPKRDRTAPLRSEQQAVLPNRMDPNGLSAPEVHSNGKREG